MNATFLKRWTRWLLPLIVLRAFIPVGFMLSAGPQGLALTFCPSIGTSIVQDAGAHDPHARADTAEDSAAGSEHRSHEQADDAPCPYGLISAAASIEPGDARLVQRTTDESFALPAVPGFTHGPPDRLHIRGPPISPKASI